MSEVIFINGPPRSGKDTLGAAICASANRYSKIEKFASPIIEHVREVLDLRLDEFEEVYKFRKDEKLFFGRSLRELMIHYSEDYIKPTYGHNWFAHNLVKRVVADNLYDLIIVTDTGFQIEYDCAKLLFENAGYSTQLIRLCRKGTSFKGDSRQYITDPGMRIINNDGTLEDLQCKIGFFNVKEV